MAMTIRVDIVSAEGNIHSGKAEMVYVPGVLGELGIAPRHAPLVTKLKPGEVRLENSGEHISYFISGGMLEIQPSVVTVLADTAIRAVHLDEAAAKAAIVNAEKAMKDKSSKIDHTKAQSDLTNAVAQLRAIDNIRNKKNKYKT